MSVSSGFRRSLTRISTVIQPYASKSCQKQSFTTTINVDKATIDVAVTGQSHKGVVLDIDGVFLRGGTPLPRAVEALKLLVANHIPFVFVTNGGGITEASKSKELTKKLEHQIMEEQIILSHTPFKHLAAGYKNDRVLVLGKEECLQVAASYGFTKAVSAKQLHEESPTLYPLRKPSTPPSSAHSGEQVKAVMLFHDPVDWGLEMQVVTDILLGRQQYIDIETQSLDLSEVERNTVPIFVSNADIVYTSDHPYPRFTQGAFVEAFKSLFEMYTSNTHNQCDLDIIFCGKPFPIQYEAATNVLQRLKDQHGASSDRRLTRFYGIGDNPKSDIRGANNCGDHWTSILVRTGVFDGIGNDEDDPADVVVQDVLDAVKYIIADTSNRSIHRPAHILESPY